MPQKGLGKGLGALIAMFDEENKSLSKDSREMKGADDEARKFFELEFDKEDAAPSVNVPRGTIDEIDIRLIDNNPNQPRKDFDAQALNELSQSIAEHGVIQPIVLNAVGARYMIVAGERRWRAAKMAGLATIPAVVRAFTPKQVAEVSIVENLQRADLNEIELARGIKSLMGEFKMTQEQVSLVLGKSRSAIANIVRLLTLPSEIQDMVENRQLSPGHAKCLVVLSDKNLCLKFAHKCLIEHLSVRQLEDLIKSYLNEGSSGSGSTSQGSALKQLAKELSIALGAKVTINGTEHKGKVVIEYYSRTDLEKIKKKLS